MASQIVTLTREQLYERVWTTPMTTLAEEYGLSDVAIAKRCKVHNIPRPPVGYWAKEAGKAPPRPGSKMRDAPFKAPLASAAHV
jgi:hypothetical protein